jgi:hypothetical protein
MKNLIERALATSYSYKEYRILVDELVKTGKTTGPLQSSGLIDYTKLNAARMKRWDKKYDPSLAIQRVASEIDQTETWLVFTEAWCGDAAHNVPILARIAALNTNINLKLVLRDENLELMDLHLTNGGRSIPKLIRLNHKYDFLASWGPRPKSLQNRVLEEKQSPSMPKEEFTLWLHKWYNTDAGKSVEKEIMELLKPVEV